MSSVRIAYIVCHLIGCLALLLGAVLAPIYATPGHYGWSVLFIVFGVLDGIAYGRRMDLWEGKA